MTQEEKIEKKEAKKAYESGMRKSFGKNWKKVKDASGFPIYNVKL